MDRKRFILEVPWPNFRNVRLSRLLPTPGNVIFTLLMIALLVAAQTAGALPAGRPQGVAPTATSTGTIAYQGRLADAAGAALTGTYNMIFRLYDAGTGGAPLWEEQWTGSNGVKVSDGLFNVMLGSLSPISSSLVASHSSLFLGITVGTDDEMAPRVQLGSVPFAVQALTVPDGSVTTEKIADAAVSQAKLGADVSLMPPDGSITTAKIADGAVTQGKLSLSNGLEMAGDLLVKGNLMLAPGLKRILFSDPGNYDFSIVHNGGSSLDFRLPEYPGGEVTAMSISNGGDISVLRNFNASGTKSAIVQTNHYGQRKLYAVEASDVRFSDEGMAQLQGGAARVELDPIFLETIESEYLVHVTPYGDASLYVAEIGKDYFVVKAREGDANAAFAWRLSATRKGYAGVRLEEVGLDHEGAK